MNLKDIKKILKKEGFVKFGNVEITLDNLNNCEVIKDGEYLFSTTSWFDIEEFITEFHLEHDRRHGELQENS